VIAPCCTPGDLAPWAAGLDDSLALVADRFTRVEPRLQARAFVHGLLAPLASKDGRTLAEAAGNETPDKMQRLLNRASWDADGVRDDVRGHVARHLGDANGVLIVEGAGSQGGDLGQVVGEDPVPHQIVASCLPCRPVRSQP
jgi:SRSO17 transposase